MDGMAQPQKQPITITLTTTLTKMGFFEAIYPLYILLPALSRLYHPSRYPTYKKRAWHKERTLCSTPTYEMTYCEDLPA